MMQAGVDIGGTFTDFVVNDGGQLKIHKILSTPHNPAEAMLKGLAHITAGNIAALTQVAHGSTVATNAILERRGAKIGLIATQGFRDVLFIGRQNRPDLYALHPQLPTPLIPRDLCYEVPERLDYRGRVLVPLDMAMLDTVLDSLIAQQVEAIAVCFLYSFVNPEHEEAVRQRILERNLLEAWQVALSSEVLPEFREYERASTVALEAYVRPIMTRYIETLSQSLPQNTSLRIMKSDGGVMNAAHIREKAVYTALSGPAAGVMGAFHVAKLAGYDQVITLDMGGTSTDVALCPGEPQVSPNSEIDGLPLRIRLLDIETIGAGGGSLVRVDTGGALRVGPQSAGSTPGPVVYGRGGEQPTVSDANAILGRLDPNHFLGGELQLDLPAAQRVFQALADQTGLTMLDAAKGVITVANSNIDRAVRRVSVARGHDPRQFTLVAFGGAGPLHACEVADRLEMPRVLIPRYPGVLCALGLLVADIVIDHSLPIMVTATRGLVARLRAMQAELLALGRDALRHEGVTDEAMQFKVLLDMRYVGQAYELTIPFEYDVVANFHKAHQQMYGHALEDRAVEIVNMRLQATGTLPKPSIEPEAAQDMSPAPAFLGDKSVLGGNTLALYDRDKLLPGMRFRGEALVFQLDATTYIPANWGVRVDSYRNLILERG
jgi:N-methylhydantoinase A